MAESLVADFLSTPPLQKAVTLGQEPHDCQSVILQCPPFVRCLTQYKKTDSGKLPQTESGHSAAWLCLGHADEQRLAEGSGGIFPPLRYLARLLGRDAGPFGT